MDADAWWIDTKDGCPHPRQSYRGTKLPCATPGCDLGTRMGRLVIPFATETGVGQMQFNRRERVVPTSLGASKMYLWHDGRKDETVNSAEKMWNHLRDATTEANKLIDERNAAERAKKDAIETSKANYEELRRWEALAHETQNKLDNAEARLRDLEARMRPFVKAPGMHDGEYEQIDVLDAAARLENQMVTINKLYGALDQIHREVTHGFAASRVLPLQTVVDHILEKIRLHRRADIRVRKGHSVPRFVEGYVTDISVEFPTMPVFDFCEQRFRTPGSSMTARVRVRNAPINSLTEYVQVFTEDEKEMELIRQKFDSREVITVELV